MEKLFEQVLNVVLPVLICAGVGYWLAWIKAPFDNKVIGGLVSRVGYPTLIISHLSVTKIDVNTFLGMMAASVLAVASFGAIGLMFLKLVRLPVRAFLTPMMHANVGNIGLPIALLALGSAGMAYTMAFVVVVLISIFTVGMWVPSGKFSLRELIGSPIILAVVISLALMTTGTQLPGPLAQSFQILGNLSIPLMLLTLGHTLATLKTGSLLRAIFLSLFHLAMGAGVGAALVQIFGFTGTERGALILCCLMPVSVATYLFIDQHQPEHAPDVAGFILVSTLMTVLAVPFALAYWV